MQINTLPTSRSVGSIMHPTAQFPARRSEASFRASCGPASALPSTSRRTHAPCCSASACSSSSSAGAGLASSTTTRPLAALTPCGGSLAAPATGLSHPRRTTSGLLAVTATSSGSTAATAAAASAGPAHVSDESKAVGCLLGAMCGNVLAAPYQGDRHYQVIRARPNGVTDFWRYDVGRQAMKYGQYTGDFSNLLAVAKSLVADRGLTSQGVLDAMLEAYSPDVRRYSPYDQIVADAVLAGSDPLQVPQLAERYLAESTRRAASSSSDSLEREPYGPSDFCAAARAAPIGVAYRSAEGPRLLSAVHRSLVFSHATPLGLDAAHVVAAAAAWCARQQPPQVDPVGCRPEALLTHLINDVAVTADTLGKLRVLRDNLVQVGEVTDWRAFYAGQQWFTLTRLLSLLSFHGYATAGSEFAAVALLAFLTSWGRPEQAVVVAASFGGHGAATAQVVGALAGALHGREWVPSRWFNALENGGGAEEGEGRDAVVETGRALSAIQPAELEAVPGGDA